jgi:hypothetical protein
MTPRDFSAAETREWLSHARQDLDACKVLIEGGLPGEALFHSQQYAEKAMKALLVWNGIPFKKTHDLEELRLACLPVAEVATSQLDGIGNLSQYAWRFRYPGAPYVPDREEAEQAQKLAADLFQAIRELLNSRMH